jgi:hypothetical protein
MTSDSDDLQQQLRENLKLRRELAAQIAQAKDGSGRIAYRLGWALYWLCLTAIGLWFVFWAAWVVFRQPTWDELPMSQWPALVWAVVLPVPPLVLYILGRALRYVLSRE